MARAWTVAVVAVLVVSLAGCATLGVKKEEKAGTVEIRVPVAEKKPVAPEPKTVAVPKVETPKPKVEVPKPKVEVPKPKVEVPKPTTVALKRGVGIDLTKVFNNDAFSSEANRKDADFDEWGQSFPAEELPKAGNFCKKELPACFVFPTLDAGKKNNIACAGQAIALAGKAKAMHLLVTATDGNQQDKVTIAYADAAGQKDLKVTDWCGAAAFGEKTAAQCAHRIAADPGGAGVLSKEAKKTHIWCVSIPLDANRELKSVKLPYNAKIHVFALTLTK